MKDRKWWLYVATAMAYILFVLFETCQGSSVVYSLKMIHKFSDEARVILTQRRGTASITWPSKRSAYYYGALKQHDVQRMNQRRELIAEYQSLYFSQGNETVQYENILGWLHYTWVDIGTPNVSFLVALDTGSDLFWVPCDCIKCAPISASSYGLELSGVWGMYRPANSSTNNHLSCSNSLCELGHDCISEREDCHYVTSYFTDDTSSSGSLMEDVLHLVSGNKLASCQSVKARVVIGCGRIQTGGFLNGGAPDGLLGLGFSDISVPSLLAKAGLVQNSFSMCFQSDDSGRIFFGDTGASDQQFTPFLSQTGSGYNVGVEGIHVGSEALKIPGFEVLIDSGTSFTYLPSNAFKRLTKEFDEQVHYPKHFVENFPSNYCYRVRPPDTPKVPTVSFVFKGGSNFSIYNPMVNLSTDNGTYFCLAVLEGKFGIVGQNFMTGYRLVFDRDNLRLGWSPSDCYQLDVNDGNLAPAPSPQNILKTPTPHNSSPRAVSPAIAGRTPKIQHSDCVQTKSNIKSCILFSFAIVAILLL